MKIDLRFTGSNKYLCILYYLQYSRTIYVLELFRNGCGHGKMSTGESSGDSGRLGDTRARLATAMGMGRLAGYTT